MIDGKYDYFAFISYRWEDEKMAEELQKTLEGYKFPTSLREKNPNLPSKIRPVFRDKTDLNGPRLEDALLTALESSRYLIVICSPKATQSDWVNRGIQRFIDLGREEDIIPFIIDGEAHADDPKNECFPPALLSLKGERAIYGININDNGRDAAGVKVVSRMFNVKYDTLWNRFLLEQKKRRRYIIASLIAAIALLLCIIFYGSWSYLKIQSQQSEIIKQRDRAEAETARANEERDKATKFNKLLVSANDSISKQKNSLQKAFNDLSKIKQSLAQSNLELQYKNDQLKQEKDNVLKANKKIKQELALNVASQAHSDIENGEIYVVYEI